MSCYKFAVRISLLLLLLLWEEVTGHPAQDSSETNGSRSIAKRSGKMGSNHPSAVEQAPSTDPVKPVVYIGAFGIIGIVLAIILTLFGIYYGLKFYFSARWKGEESANNYAHMNDTLPLGDYKKNKETASQAPTDPKMYMDPKLYIGFNLGLFPNGPKAPKVSDRDLLMDSAYKNANMSVDQPDRHSMSDNSESNLSSASSGHEKKMLEDEPAQIRISQTELSVPLRKDEIETTI